MGVLFKRIKYIVLLSFILFQHGYSQDPTYSQFYANPLYLAPSFAGATEEYRLGLNYRNQWPAIPGVFHTYSISFDRAMPNFNSGLGILASYDVAGSGELSTTNIGLLYSYDFNISRDWHIRPGVHFKFYYLGLDIYKLVFNSQMTGSGTNLLFIPRLLIMWLTSTLPHQLLYITTGSGQDSLLTICWYLKHLFMERMPMCLSNLIFLAECSW